MMPTTRAVHAREAGDDRLAEGGLQLEDGVAVGDPAHDLAHVVGPAPVARHDVLQAVLAAVDGVAGAHDRRQLPDVLRHVAQVAADQLEALLLVLRDLVDRAREVGRQRRAAEVLLV